MDNCKQYIGYTCLILMAVIMGGCGSSSSSSTPTTTTTTTTYSTTSSKGDYAEWTISGSSLNATWNVEDTTGAIDYTFTLAADCGSPDTYGVRSCTISSSSCAAGASACSGTPPSGSFDMMDVPGVALFVHTGSGSTAQLHIGFAKDSTACTADVSGDYTMIATGLGSEESFGVYQSDANFINIIHADFGFTAPDAITTSTVAYRTSGGTGDGMDTLSDGGCVDGVRTRTAGTDTIRSMMTSGGLFILDFPAGKGGLVSFKTANAATLADFAGKSFGGISFPDIGNAEPIKADFGALSGDQVSGAATVGTNNLSLAVETLTTSAAATSPGFPDFTVAPAAYSANSLLASAYTTPDAIPGLFKLDDTSATDTGRVIMAAMKYNGKIIGVGLVYNYRGALDTNPATGSDFGTPGLYNTGNFILFEK